MLHPRRRLVLGGCDGRLMYYDAKGGVQRLEMERRQADVVCPILFTKEHANTARLTNARTNPILILIIPPASAYPNLMSDASLNINILSIFQYKKVWPPCPGP